MADPSRLFKKKKKREKKKIKIKESPFMVYGVRIANISQLLKSK